MDSKQTIWDVLPKHVSRPQIERDVFWANYERQASNVAIHIAILSKKYVGLILSKDKTIESRFSLHRRIPFERVKVGDVLLLKESGGPIVGLAYVSKVWFYHLDADTLQQIRTQFGHGLQIHDDEFWERCESRSYATLMELENVRSIAPIRFPKRDRNAWSRFDSISS